MKAETGVITMDNVPNVIDTLNKKIESLKEVTGAEWKTSGTLEGFGDIKKVTNVETLIKAYASVNGMCNAYNNSITELELGSTETPVFTVNGGTKEAWKHDIKLQINIINYKETLDTLNGFKSEMAKFLSEEDQKAILMKKLTDYLSK